ncbi:flagellar hook-associated protein FlgK [Limisalsivibrio acetivorans]|uniref:flagellar hook-associated protein FlgK n=1 Tax=Limisalsivibrio acetivorans TaxID=1304888 RepID=UPI0003B42984|nr:flagellar hook-associated protein FlgK [Limisalsivibrio acetivorans]
MSNIYGMLSSGISGLMAAQAGIDVSGHNIANVNTDGYSRQTVSLDTQSPALYSQNMFGRGVTVEDINRVYDELLASSVREENAELEYYKTLQTGLEKAKVYFNELEDGSGLGEALRDYFNAWSDVANNPPDESEEALVKRQTLVETTETLTQKIHDGYDALSAIQKESDYNITEYVNQINQISDNITYLNKQIAVVEATDAHANDYRDQRDALLKELSELVNVNVYERENTQIAVYVGGNALVDENESFKLYAERDTEQDNKVSVKWGTSESIKGEIDISSQITGGKLGAEFETRDETIAGYKDELDELASTLINETNRIHSLGQGVIRLNQITSTNGVPNPSFVMGEDAGAFPVDVNKGTFRITVYDSSGDPVDNYDIDIDPTKDNLNNVIAKISAADGDVSGGKIQASLSLNNTVKIYSEAGYSFAFTDDTSNFLVGAGINSYFKGTGAEDIEIADLIQDNNLYIATGRTGADGDNEIAKDIADLKFKEVFEGESVTIDEFYGYFVSGIGSDKHKVDIFVETKQNALDEMELKLEGVKGVSMDEELTLLLRFQRSYEASARFITTVDSMLEKLINGLGLVGR